MDTVIKLFDKIKNTRSRNEKIDIIKSNKDNELFIEDLKFLLDPSVITGISASKLKKDVGVINAIEIKNLQTERRSWFALKSWLLDHPTGTKREIVACQKFLKSVPEDHREFYEQMITKKYRLGCDCKTVNEAIPGLIKVYETQQAYPISDKNRPKSGEWFSLSEKLNGINGGFINGKCLSRQGKPISGMQHIISDLEKLGLQNYYVNGELIRYNHDNIPDDENFQLTTSIVNSDSNTPKREIHFIFYEIIPLDEFYAGKSKLKYSERLKVYKKIALKIENEKLKYIHFVDQYYDGKSQKEIQEWLDWADSHNKEGIMLNKDTYWEAKRNNGLLKVKTFKSCDIRCIGVEEGDGKNSGTLGRINCDYKGNVLGVGSGFTDEQRDYFWKYPEEIIGKIVTVKYKTETKNKQNGVSVQFPVFVCVRKDKNTESYEN